MTFTLLILMQLGTPTYQGSEIPQELLNITEGVSATTEELDDLDASIETRQKLQALADAQSTLLKLGEVSYPMLNWEVPFNAFDDMPWLGKYGIDPFEGNIQ